MLSERDFEGEEGLVTRCDRVTVWHGPSAGFDGDPERQWLTHCEIHGTLASWESLAGPHGALEKAKTSVEWCSGCRG